MTVKEQLSASKQKIVLPNKELVGVKKEEKKEIDESSKLPEPSSIDLWFSFKNGSTLL